MNKMSNTRRKKKYIDEPELILTDKIVLGETTPANIDAEKVVLGAMLLDRGIIPVLTTEVNPEMMYSQSNQIIYRSIWNLYLDNKPVDLISVKTDLQARSELETCGGSLYLIELTSGVASTANSVYHAKLIHQSFIKRRLIQIGHEINKQGFDPVTDGFEIMEHLQKEIFDLSSGAFKRTFESYANLCISNLKLLQERMMNTAGLTGIETGFYLQNMLTSGWQPCDLVIIGGRPGMGKTALALYYAVSAAKTGYSVLIFSLEMSAGQLVFRIQSMESGIDGAKIRSGQLSDSEFNTFRIASESYSSMPIYIDDTPGISIQELKSKAIRMSHEGKADLIIIDYIQLMSAGDHHGNREQEVAYISKSLKGLAKDLEVPVIALAQLSRDVEKSGRDKRPGLSSLRESGAIEQDADLVIFPYRPEYYGEEFMEDGMTPAVDMAEIIVAKQRNGATGNFMCRYDKRLTRFGQYTPDNAYQVGGTRSDMFVDRSNSAPF